MTTPPPPAEPLAEEEREYPHWTRVYVTVVVYTIALIFTLWLISKQYQ
jgi:hypothetical protein